MGHCALLRVLTVGSVVGQVSGRSIGVLVVKEGPAHFEPVTDLCVEGRALGKVVVVLS